MTIVEILVTTVLLVIAVSGFASTMINSMRLEQVNEETAVAAEAAKAYAAQLQSYPFEQVFARFNASAADDPDADSPGPDFEVAGLPPRPEDDDGLVGEVIFPTVGDALREDVTDAALGMPRDLNADGSVDGADHSDDYFLLPVLIRLEWRGVAGNRRLDTTLYLVE